MLGAQSQLLVQPVIPVGLLEAGHARVQVGRAEVGGPPRRGGVDRQSGGVESSLARGHGGVAEKGQVWRPGLFLVGRQK